jgi:hypothetical protein
MEKTEMKELYKTYLANKEKKEEQDYVLVPSENDGEHSKNKENSL